MTKEELNDISISNIEAASVKLSVENLTLAFAKDQELANGWHDNIAMAMFEGFPEDSELYVYEQHEIANKGASNFMKRVFNITTKIPTDR